MMPDMDEYRGDPQTFAIIGAAMEVHRVLGCGFAEVTYQEALALELDERLIPCQREVALPIPYKWETLPSAFRADFVCYGEIIVELKAISRLTALEYAQVTNYMRVTGFQRGLLLNFGTQSLEVKRFVNTRQRRSSSDESRPRRISESGAE